MKFTEIMETVNPYLIPKDEDELKRFQNKSKVPNIQQSLKSGKIIPTGGPNEILRVESKQADKKFISLREKTIKLDWFKKFLKDTNLKLVNLSEIADVNTYFPKADIALVHNEDKFYKLRVNLQSGNCYKFNKQGGSKNGWTGSSIYSLKSKDGYTQDLGSLKKIKEFFLNELTKYILGENKKTPNYELKLDKDKIDLKDSIVNSNWFKNLLKKNKFTEAPLEHYRNKDSKDIEICIMNSTHLYSFNLQNPSVYKKPINGVYAVNPNPQITIPFKQISKNLNEQNFKEFLIENFFPNL